MRTVDEIIGRAQNVLCVSARCGLEYSTSYGEHHPKKEREEQRLVIYDWLQRNGYAQYMTETEKYLYEKKVGNLYIKMVHKNKGYEREAIKVLLWSIGIEKRLTAYDRLAYGGWQGDNDVHMILKTDVADEHEKLLKKASVRSPEEIELKRKIARLWYWRARNGKNPRFLFKPVKEVVIEVFGDDYICAVDRILKWQKDKKDFQIYGKYIYKLDTKHIRSLYMRSKWRYHAFEWLLSEEEWDDVSLKIK